MFLEYLEYHPLLFTALSFLNLSISPFSIIYKDISAVDIVIQIKKSAFENILLLQLKNALS